MALEMIVWRKLLGKKEKVNLILNKRPIDHIAHLRNSTNQKNEFVLNFAILSPWKRAWPFGWTDLNSLKFFVQSVIDSGEQRWKCEMYTDRRIYMRTDDR